LYKEHLLLWTPSGELQFLSLSELRNQVVKQYGRATAVVADYLIFRNDWKRSKQFLDLMSMPLVAHEILRPLLDNGGRLRLALEADSLGQAASDPLDGYLLDASIYGNRVFAATDNGLFETAFDPRFSDNREPLLQHHHGANATGVETHAGRLAVSLGSDGLRTRSIEFGSGDSWWVGLDQKEQSKIDEISYDVSFASYSLLNYNGNEAPSFLRANLSTQKAGSGSMYDVKLIEKFDRGLDLGSSMTRVAKSGESIDVEKERGSLTDDSVRVVGNANYKLLLATNNGDVVVNLSAYEKKPVLAVRNKDFSRAANSSRFADDALSTQTLSSGFLIEAFDYTAVITAHGSFKIIEEPRARVRSFPRSRRHDDAFTAVGDGFVELVGFVEYQWGAELHSS
jgi:hypothetical protein